MSNSNIFRKALLLTGLAVGLCRAIDPHRAVSQYVRSRWGAEQGLPRGSVYAITQTQDGYLWIGAEAGLFRFDGLHFVQIRDTVRSLPLKGIVGLAADKDGALWIRLGDTMLLRYNKGSIEKLDVPAESVIDITAIGRGVDGGLLAARGQAGAFTFRSGKIVMAAEAKDVPRSPVSALAQTANGDIWMGTRSVGLFRLHGGATEPVQNGLPDAKINCLLPDENNQLWIGTDQGITHWNGTELSAAGLPSELTRSQILSMVKDRDGNLWTGTDTGTLLRFNRDGLAAIEPVQGNPRNAITALFEDREGSLWFGSGNGLERLRDSVFVTYSLPEGLPTDGSNPVFADDEGRVWFPPVDGGLWWMKDGRHGTISNDGLDKDIVYSLAGAEHELWIGRQRGGLTRLSSANGGFTAKTYTKADGLAQDNVYSVYRTRGGAIWAGTLSGGVSKLDHGAFTTYTTAAGLASNTVASIAEGADGTMWFATPVALSALGPSGQWSTFTPAQGLPSANVNCVFEDSQGVLWAGTTAGLAFFQSGRFFSPGTVPPALKEQVLGIAEDRAGFLWAATSNHVLRFSRELFMKGTLGDAGLRQYGLADGLRGIEGVKRHRSVIADGQGRIWMSLNQGISMADPSRLTTSSAAAIPHVQTISADGVSIPLAGAIHIPSGRQRIVFGFTGLTLAVPDRARFKYRLEGYDTAWTPPAPEGEATYTKLGPGPYRLHLLASNPDGVWSTNEAVLDFTVEAAFWQTWWFYGAAGVAIVLAARALYLLRMRHLTSRLNARFEERLAERTRIAQELHDTLLQGFLSASMQVHVVADRLPPESPVRPALTRAMELMTQVIDEGRNAVRGLRSTRSASLDLEEAFARIQDELPLEDQAKDPVDFRVIAEGSYRAPLHPIVRDEVFRIGREALRNAFRHSKARTIEIELNYSPSQLRMLVRDDGCGIDAETLQTGRDGHYGLAGMRERAERIGGQLRLFSNLDAGTEVELTVPGHAAFETKRKTKDETIKWTGNRR